MNKIAIWFMICIYFFLTNGDLCAQVVNIEKERIRTDTTGLSGELELKGSYLDNGKKIFSFNLEPELQYKSYHHLYLLLLDYKVTKSQDVEFQNAAFIHFRYNYEISDFFRWEAFSQVQYNKVSKLAFRSLTGTGPRFKLVGVDNFRLYLGILPMFEYEKLLDEQHTEYRDVRLSNYLSWTVVLNEYTKLASTTYYQPLLNQWQDARVYNENRLIFKISKKLDATLGTTYTWDARPPVNAPQHTFMTEVGVELEFK